MECFQRGFLTANDGDGLALTWGDESSALTFMHQLAHGSTEMTRAAGRGIINLIEWVCEKYQARAGKPCRQELLKFAMHVKGLPFSFYRTHRSLSMQGSYSAASDIGAHHAAAWLIKADLLGAFPTFEAKARALVTYPRVRLGNDNWGVCKLPWVDVFNPESSTRINTDIYINPASQEIYADFYNGMMGTNFDWEQLFARTDRDINLQRVLNVLRYRKETCNHDWIPDRAIGPTEDALYESELEYNDQDLAKRLGKKVEDLAGMPTSEKRELLMSDRKKELRHLINVYYEERGWNSLGVPTPGTLKQLGLWDFLDEEARSIISNLN
jgi:aldehyde:ferredoxin oxidoreductase